MLVVVECCGGVGCGSGCSGGGGVDGSGWWG